MPKRIFIVDDSKTIRQLGRTYLETRLELIVRAKATDGLEGAADLHGMLPRVPIILFTSHNDIVPERQAQAVGIRAVVSKTDQSDVLLREVLNFVGVGTAATV